MVCQEAEASERTAGYPVSLSQVCCVHGENQPTVAGVRLPVGHEGCGYLEYGSFSKQPLRQVFAGQLPRGLQLLVPVPGLRRDRGGRHWLSPCPTTCSGKSLPPPPHGQPHKLPSEQDRQADGASREAQRLPPGTHQGRGRRCPGKAGPGCRHLSRNVLLITQPRGVGVLCAHAVHGMLCLGGRPAVHLEWGGNPLERVALDPTAAEEGRWASLPSLEPCPEPLL